MRAGPQSKSKHESQGCADFHISFSDRLAVIVMATQGRFFPFALNPSRTNDIQRYDD
ncbi:hypothetical protein FHW69_001613 [Luteibacter sp. Sphag1AF]|uniref:hypothetical protein n=1 Tax=Luteibacter sp. Sphag1AF TaxID=2587031 RepID=UPI001610437A|nr:hypothetical protein [Luteibacter sp. Sphag1AF]MBB3227012.1 hypothetical protein [Luteibacter sp. Sphag1AF]